MTDHPPQIHRIRFGVEFEHEQTPRSTGRRPSWWALAALAVGVLGVLATVVFGLGWI